MWLRLFRVHNIILVCIANKIQNILYFQARGHSQEQQSKQGGGGGYKNVHVQRS